MINPSSAIQTIVTQIKDILAATTVTTIVKIKARTNNTWQMKITLGAITKTIITLKEQLLKQVFLHTWLRALKFSVVTFVVMATMSKSINSLSNILFQTFLASQ